MDFLYKEDTTITPTTTYSVTSKVASTDLYILVCVHVVLPVQPLLSLIQKLANTYGDKNMIILLCKRIKIVASKETFVVGLYNVNPTC
jgi:hypothetical protein